eukprot:496018-Pleurochrysis_carterae.AAC.1
MGTWEPKSFLHSTIGATRRRVKQGNASPRVPAHLDICSPESTPRSSSDVRTAAHYDSAHAELARTLIEIKNAELRTLASSRRLRPWRLLVEWMRSTATPAAESPPTPARAARNV